MTKTRTTPTKESSKKTVIRYRDSKSGAYVAQKKSWERIPNTGFTPTESGVLIPTSLAKPVPASKMRSGIEKARKEISDTLDTVVSAFSSRAEVAQIELSVGFNADGKFLGFGVGGDVSLKITINPKR